MGYVQQGGEETSSSTSKRVKPPYFGSSDAPVGIAGGVCVSGMGMSWGGEVAAIVVCDGCGRRKERKLVGGLKVEAELRLNVRTRRG